MWGSKNLSLCIGLKSHTLIIIRPRRRNHERESPVTDNKAYKCPRVLVRKPPRI